MKKIIGYLIIACFFCACEDLLDVYNISNEKVHLLAPVDSTVTTTNKLTFTWSRMEGAEKYHLQIAQPSFDQALQIVRDTLVDTINFSDSLGVNSYQWRVRAENSAYTSAYTINTLTIEE